MLMHLKIVFRLSLIPKNNPEYPEATDMFRIKKLFYTLKYMELPT